MTHEAFLTQLGKKTLARLLAPFRVNGNVSCGEIFYALPIEPMSKLAGETVTGFRLRWLELINRALGCMAASAASSYQFFRVEPEENEASALVASTFGTDTLEALRHARLSEVDQ